MARSIQAGNKLFPDRHSRDTPAVHAARHRNRNKGERNMRSIFKLAVDAFIAGRERRARARLLDQLDERTLRDIGFEHEANRAREQSRRPFLRFGMY
jgi:hypothetical protein